MHTRLLTLLSKTFSVIAITTGLLGLTVALGIAAASVVSGKNGTAVRTVIQESASVTYSQQQAQQWGLTDTEWQRYEQMKNGIRGIQSPGLDPLTLLGVEAESASERRRLAELWVDMEYRRVEKELLFQREVDAAWGRLFPSVLPVNMGNAAGIVRDNHGRLALFVRDDCVRCDARLSAVLADNRPVDIYLVGSNGKDETVRQWAVKHHIPLERVRSRHITLNHDKGLWAQHGQGQMPVVLQQGEDGWHIAAF